MSPEIRCWSVASTSMGSLSVPSEVADLIRHWISARLREGATTTELAALLHTTHVTVINVRDAKLGVGPKLEQRVAELLYGGSVDALRMAAKGLPTPSGVDEQYPNRARAIEAARLLRTASEEAIESVCSWTDRKDAQGWTEQDWYDELLTEDRRRRRGRVEPARSFVDEAPPGRKGKKR